jgi:hypothetical protein
MEADDNEGDTDDLWVTLSSMGYNKGLVQDEVKEIQIYCSDCWCEQIFSKYFPICNLIFEKMCAHYVFCSSLE